MMKWTPQMVALKVVRFINIIVICFLLLSCSNCRINIVPLIDFEEELIDGAVLIVSCDNAFK